MKYAILRIDTPESNRGNRLIEYAIKKLLGLKEPTISIPMFRKPDLSQLDQINHCDFVLLPGSTILAKGKGQGEAMDALKKIKIPKFCIGASGWSPLFKLNFKAMKYIDGPIGVRDPYTYNQCKEKGFPVKFVGCPTMLLPAINNQAAMPYDIIGFSRDCVDWQIHSLFNYLSHNSEKNWSLLCRRKRMNCQ